MTRRIIPVSTCKHAHRARIRHRWIVLTHWPHSGFVANRSRMGASKLAVTCMFRSIRKQRPSLHLGIVYAGWNDSLWRPVAGRQVHGRGFRWRRGRGWRRARRGNWWWSWGWGLWSWRRAWGWFQRGDSGKAPQSKVGNPNPKLFQDLRLVVFFHLFVGLRCKFRLFVIKLWSRFEEM